MCYAIPGQVVALDGRVATIEYFGERKRAYNEMPFLRVGDFVYAQGGFVIKVIPPEEAQEVLATWKETFFELQELDLRLSRLAVEGNGVARNVLRILDKALEERPLSREELLTLLRLKNPREREYLYKVANFLRRKNLGNGACVHGILEISSFCRRNCAYCGLSLHNRGLSRYRMTEEEILAASFEAVEVYGFQALVLQSGEDPGLSVEKLARIVREIRKRHAVLIFVSFGEVGLEGLEELYEAGARGLLLRFETGNPSLYAKLHPGYTLATRLAHLEKALELGYLVATGGLIGLPGQTLEGILEDILLAKSLGAEMYSFGPFIPHPGTPLSSFSPPPPFWVLNALAVARIVDPERAKILVTTAFETLDPQAARLGLLAGANSLMLNVTPLAFRPKYDLYPQRAHVQETMEEQIAATLSLLRSLGRAPTDLGVGTPRES
ncbi:MAG: [FeFe] hydrogenase H-cluster radical SAM maturase HydE [Candidatus Caldatribacterium sp.]|nr:[FeFe] hydrogenase H-cluster radical SAM maturase HydE [Candidatus Caldatribacterium sp.]